MSVVPPAGKPTIKRTDRAGYACARALRETTEKAVAAAARRKKSTTLKIHAALVPNLF
jgi:hypothetical protein